MEYLGEKNVMMIQNIVGESYSNFPQPHANIHRHFLTEQYNYIL